MKRYLTVMLAICLMLAQLSAFAAASRSLQPIHMGDEEFDRLSSMFDQAAITAWQAEHPEPRLDLEQDGLGAMIYYLEELEGRLSLKADLYQVPMLKLSVEEAPEGSLRWLAHVEAELHRDSGAASGFVIDGLRFSQPYQAQSFSVYENPQAGYEVMLPDSFQWPNAPDSWDNLVITSVDGRASITIVVSRDGGETPEESRVRMLAENAALQFEAPSPYSPEIVAQAPGLGMITVSAPEAIYRLKLSYPAELEAEYQLVFEFLRNSFVISEIAVG